VQAVNSNERRVMPLKSNNSCLNVRVPHKDLKIETNTHDDLVFFRVRDLSDSLCVPFQNLGSLFALVIFSFHLVLFLKLVHILRIITPTTSISSVSHRIRCPEVIVKLLAIVHWRPQIPEMNFLLVGPCRNLVDVGQVYQAKDNISHKPWSFHR